MKKTVALVLVLVLSLTLTACEASKISKAKCIVDKIVVHTIEMIDAEIQLESATTDQKIATYQMYIETKEELIEFLWDDLEEIWVDLSANGQKEVQEYIDTVYREAVEQHNNS